MAKKEQNMREFIEELNQEFNTYKEPEIIKTGYRVLDGVLNGGIATNTIMEIASESGVGKSTITLNICKVLCSQGYNVLYIDSECGVKDDLLKKTGVYQYKNNVDKSIGGTFSIFAESSAVKIDDLLDKVCPTEKFQFIVIDSLYMISTDSYLGKDKTSLNAGRMGDQARMLSILLKKINRYRTENHIGFILVNQMRQVIGGYIPRNELTGGAIVRYVPDIIIEMSSGGELKSTDGTAMGRRIYIKASKSRYGAGHIKTAMYVLYGYGICNSLSYVDLLEEGNYEYEGKPICVKAGSWYTINIGSYTEKFQGRDGFVKAVLQNEKFFNEYFKDNVFSMEKADVSMYLETMQNNYSNTSTNQEVLFENDKVTIIEATDELLDEGYAGQMINKETGEITYVTAEEIQNARE